MGKEPSNKSHAAPQTDARFARLHTDPRFLKPKASASKAVLDERFSSLLSGGADAAKGKGKAKGKEVDKYGRKGVTEQTEDLSKLYRLEGDESEDSEEEEEGGVAIDYARGEGLLESSGGETSSEEEDEDEESENDYDGVLLGRSNVRRAERKRQAAAEAFSDDDDDEDEDDEEIAGAQELPADEATLAELDAQAAANLRAEAASGEGSSSSAVPRAGAQVLRGDATSRIALVNLDWDHVRAIDLLVIFASLVSPSATRLPGTPAPTDRRGNAQSTPVKGSVLRVRIYPSEFGQARTEKENKEGPPKEIFRTKEEGGSSKKKRKQKKKTKAQEEEEDDEEDVPWEVDEGGEFDEEMLRRYQLERLRYYYAVAEFDSAGTAQHVYQEIDGTEMERTANVFDLRFIPADMEFPSAQGGASGWRDEARQGDEQATYRGVDFKTDALRHSKVKLTWDADDSARAKVTRAVNRELSKSQLRDEDFKAYLASASEDEEQASDEEEPAGDKTKFRSLLGLDDEGAASSSTRKARSKAFEDARAEPEEGDMQITFLPGLSEAAARKASGKPAKDADDKDETTIEKYRRKQKEKKARRKAGELDDDEEQEAAQPDADEPIGFDDPFFAGGADDAAFSAALEAELGGATSKAAVKEAKAKLNKAKKAPSAAPASAQEAAEAARSKAELELLVDSEEEGARAHFDMKDVLRAESGKSADKHRGKRGKKIRSKPTDDAEPKEKLQSQDGFRIDVADERFGAVFEDHTFALDPSHPSFVKTKSMKTLLDERRRRQDAKAPAEHGGEEKVKKRKKQEGGEEEGNSDLKALVSSVKKRAGGENVRGARGKKRKT